MPSNGEARVETQLYAAGVSQIRFTQPAAARAPDNAEYHINLGEVQRRRGKLPESLAAFRRGVQLAPHNAFAHYNLAVTLQDAGRHDDGHRSAGSEAATRADVPGRRRVRGRRRFSERRGRPAGARPPAGRFSRPRLCCPAVSSGL